MTVVALRTDVVRGSTQGGISDSIEVEATEVREIRRVKITVSVTLEEKPESQAVNTGVRRAASAGSIGSANEVAATGRSI